MEMDLLSQEAYQEMDLLTQEADQVMDLLTQQADQEVDLLTQDADQLVDLLTLADQENLIIILYHIAPFTMACHNHRKDTQMQI